MLEIPKAYEFQTSAETLRAHHWRAYADTYKGCAFECQYCLYKGPGPYGAHVKPTQGTIEASSDLGILDLGTTTDPYQPVEADHKLTRGILESAAEAEIPLFLLTRGDLVLRDVDVLSDLAQRGLVEVCLSVITLNEDVTRVIEPEAPSPQRRIALAEELRSHDIPVAFHVAPLIPGVDAPADLEAMGSRLAAASGSHVFSAMLGARKPYWQSFYSCMDNVADSCASFSQFERAYPRDIDFTRGAADVCEFDDARDALEPLRTGVVSAGAVYVSENYPFLTTGALEGGIYRWKLPTVYDMACWIHDQSGPANWSSFLAWYKGFWPSDAQVDLVSGLWDSGELFLGTLISRIESDEGIQYAPASEPILPARRTLVAQRNPIGR